MNDLFSSRRWLSIGLVIMLFALVSFSTMPLLTAIFQSKSTNAAVPTAVAENLRSRVSGYLTVLEREPDNRTALQGLLDSYLQLGDLRGAIEPLEKLALLEPGNIQYSLLLAATKRQVGDPEAAIGIYRALLASSPDNIGILKNLTDLLVSLDRAPEAIAVTAETLDKALNAKETEPAAAVDVVSVQLLLGEIYFGQKNYDEALKVYDTASVNDPADFRPLLGKAIVLEETGKSEEAEPLFERALNLAPFQYREDIRAFIEKPEAKGESRSN